MEFLGKKDVIYQNRLYRFLSNFGETREQNCKIKIIY